MANGSTFSVDWRALGLALFLAGNLGSALWFGGSITSEMRTISRDLAKIEGALTTLAASVQENRADLAALKASSRQTEKRLDGLERPVP